MEPNEDLLRLGVSLGQAHSFGVVAGRCSAAQAEHLRRLREEKRYLQLSPVWREFCPKYLGMSSSQADRIISQLDEFGPKFFQLSQLTRISAETYRAIAPAVQDGAIQVNGDTIELAPENARQVAAAVAELRRGASGKKPEPPKPRDPVAEVNHRFLALRTDIEALMRAQGSNAHLLCEDVNRMGYDLRMLAQRNRP
jgi:hypothetical protein